MLGANDICFQGPKEASNNLLLFVKSIIDKNPEIKIIIESMTPIVKERQFKNFSNDIVREYNQELIKICKEKNFTFLDVYKVLQDKNGDLDPKYCSDKNDRGIHLTNDACCKWIELLKEFQETI